MRKLYILAFTVLIINFSTSILSAQSGSNYKIDAKIGNNTYNGKKVYLQTFNYETLALDVIDSTTVNNNAFTFIGNASKPVYSFILAEGSNKPLISFINEEGTINLTIDAISKVEGTPGNEALQAFTDKQNESNLKIKSLLQEYKEAEKNKTITPEFEKQLEKNYNENVSSLLTDAFNFTKENITNGLGEFYFISLYHTFDPKETKELLQLLTPEFKETKAAKKISTYINSLTATEIGSKYTDLRFPNPEGKDIAISDYVGKHKYILIDFWASWCGPCLREMPSYVSTYSKFKDKGFEIIGVSFDQNKASWLAASKRLGVVWPQMSDLKGWESEASAIYGIKTIPSSLLLDENGNIIAKDINGTELEDILSKLLN